MKNKTLNDAVNYKIAKGKARYILKRAKRTYCMGKLL